MLLGILFLSVMVVQFEGMATAKVPSLAPADPQTETEVVVHIQTRKFQPNTLSLRSGDKIRLILRNQDAELHAFVPVGLFLKTALNVSGNGAPQFGPDGLLRVLLPSQGQTEILFVPERPGSYPFFCDLPGHVMQGTIVVQE